jgi:hypothetical protein
MKQTAILLVLSAMIVIPGCVSHRDEPTRVVMVQTPAPPPVVIQSPPTVIVREDQRFEPSRTSPTATPAAPPVHGSRYRVEEIEVIYDQPLRAYTVVGRDDYYYVDNRFYRYDRGRWEYSPNMNRDARWVSIREREVPESLVIAYRR